MKQWAALPRRFSQMPSPKSSRALVLALLLSALTTAGLLLEAVRSERRHRVAVARVLNDYARSAGWLFANAYRAEVETEMLTGLGPAVLPLPRAGHAEPVTPQELERWAANSAVCAGDTQRFYFTVALPARVVRTSGAEPSAQALALLRGRSVTARLDEGTWGILSHRGHGPERRVLVFGVQRDSVGLPAALLGFDSCQQWIFDKLASVYQNRPLLPPFLVGDAPADSLLSIVVTRVRAGDTVFRSPRQYHSAYAAATPSIGLEGLQFGVAINPAVAAQLVIGGLPRSRLPWLLSLLLITGVAFAVLLFQLRQGFRLARARTDFVTSASHEIRTPLAQILLFGESLKFGTARSAAERRMAIDVIVQEASRLIHLADNVLHFSRDPLRSAPPATEVLPLAPLIRQTVTAFEPLARHRRAEFALELDEAVTAVVDPDALRQVLINLLDNAVKFGPACQRLGISLDATSGRAVIGIADRGPGIPAKSRQAIWAPFTRLNAGSNRAPGNGIGLAVVRDLVSRQHGQVWVEDREGGGSRFLVSLPQTR